MDGCPVKRKKGIALNSGSRFSVLRVSLKRYFGKYCSKAILLKLKCLYKSPGGLIKVQVLF